MDCVIAETHFRHGKISTPASVNPACVHIPSIRTKPNLRTSKLWSQFSRCMFFPVWPFYFRPGGFSGAGLCLGAASIAGFGGRRGSDSLCWGLASLVFMLFSAVASSCLEFLLPIIFTALSFLFAASLTLLMSHPIPCPAAAAGPTEPGD